MGAGADLDLDHEPVSADEASRRVQDRDDGGRVGERKRGQDLERHGPAARREDRPRAAAFEAQMKAAVAADPLR